MSVFVCVILYYKMEYCYKEVNHILWRDEEKENYKDWLYSKLLRMHTSSILKKNGDKGGGVSSDEDEIQKEEENQKREIHSSTNSNSQSEVSSTLEREAPDGGWGWLVVLAAFLVNFIADGITLSFGEFFKTFVKEFGSSKGTTSWIGSLLTSMPLLCGPIASTLTDRYGCRRVTIVGGLLASIGFGLSYFATSIQMLMLTYGLITGFGLALCSVAAVVIVAYYFERKRSFATGISVAGGGIGTFFFSPLTSYLISVYNWRVTLLILAGCFLVLTICGLLMKDLEWTKSSHRKRERRERNLDEFLHVPKMSLKQGKLKGRKCNSAICIPTFVQEEQKTRHSEYEDKNNLEIMNSLPPHRVSLTYRGAVISLKRFRLRPASSCPDIISVATNEDRGVGECRTVLKELYVWMRGIFAWDNLSNTRFLLFVISNFLLYTWYDIPYYFLSDSATDIGYTDKQGSMLGGTIGLCNVFGNLLLGYIGDQSWANSVTIYGICISICGIVTALMPLCFNSKDDLNYYQLCVLGGVFGVMIAANYSLTSVILVKVVSLEKFTNAYGLLLLMQGIGNLVGPPIAGALYDHTSSWKWSFWFAGGGILISNIFILAPIYRRHENESARV